MDKRKSVLLAAVLACTMTGSAFAAGPAVILPPELDYATHCAVPETVRPVLDRDWTTWTGGRLELPADQVTALALEYAKGSERVAKSADTALRLLGALEGQVDPGRLDRLVARVLISANRSADDAKEGEARLLRAFASGEREAALDLARLYGVDGPRNLRDPAKARSFAQIAAASGDANGKLIYATIIAADPAVSAEQKSFATEAAMLAMVGEIVAGNCSKLTTMGLLYQRGGLVAADMPTALEWFKKAAQTGDIKAEERLGDLISGSRVAVNDFALAYDFYQKAADKGSASAALKVGKDFAAGLVRPRDLEQAQHYLTAAAEAGAKEADLWLARLKHGDFGGAKDLAAAKEFYRKAIAARAFDAELASEFGLVLLEPGASADELAEARTLLTDAAYAGSGIAAVKVGEMLLAEAQHDPSLYTEVETFMRLGDALGRSESARHMAEISACAGPLHDPAAAAAWTERAMALGANNVIFNQGAKLAGSTQPEQRARGWALLQRVAVEGDPRALGYALAQLRAGSGGLSDPQLQAELERFVAGKTGDAEFERVFQLALISADMELPDADTRLDAALAALDGMISANNPDAVLLKADLLKKHRGATPAELLPLYQRAAELGVAKGMRELGNGMLADPSADVGTARGWLQKAAAAGDVKASMRLVDMTAPTAMAELKAIAQSGMVCSSDAMVEMARTYSASIDPAATSEAAQWLALATAAAGDKVSDLIRIASAYKKGVAGADQVGAAEPLLGRAMQLGSTEAAKSLASGHLEGIWPDADPDLAHQLLAGLAAEGDGEAGAKLLQAIADGKIEAPANEVTALVAKSRSQLDDNGRTLLRLARLDEDGALGAPDPARRLEWLEAAAAAGDADAMMRLYRTYASGIGVAVAPEQAFAWLEKAADGGDPRAARELAAAYTVGFGTVADPQKAAEWRARAQVVVN